MRVFIMLVSWLLVGLVTGVDAQTFFVNPSGDDDTLVIQNAINSAVAAGNSTVILNAGTYNLKTYNGTYSAHLYINGGTGITIQGSGTVRLQFWNTSVTGLKAISTRDLTLNLLYLDYYYHPWGQGTVYSVDTVNKVVWITGDTGYAGFDSPYFDHNNATTFLTRTTRGNTPPKCDLLPVAQDGAYWGYMDGLNWFMYGEKVNCAGADDIAPGQKVALIRSSWTAFALHLRYVKGANITNTTIYSSPGVATLVDHTERGTTYDKINFNYYNIAYHPEDTSRTITTNADGIHALGSRARINVTNSLFYGQADDAINLHTRDAYFYSLVGNVLSYAPSGGFENLKAGDSIEIFNPSDMVARCIVTATGNPYGCSGGECIAVNGGPCVGMIAYDGINKTSCDQIANTCQTYDCSTGLGSNISNNYFYGSRGRAIINRDWKTTITNNTIGSTFYGKPNWYGIYEGYCAPGDLWYNEGRLVYPGRDGGQVITGNTGVYGNTVYGCWPGCSNQPVKRAGTYYNSLQNAYDEAVDGDIIQSQDTILYEDLFIDRNISVIIKAGYDCDYTSTDGISELSGDIYVESGSLSIESGILHITN